jgi:hypothetical protein
MEEAALFSTVRTSAAKVLSLDFFDTLCLRKSENPVKLFWSIGEEFRRRGVLPASFVSERFVSLRIAAEATARSQKIVRLNSPEVSLRDIYLQFVKLTGFDRPSLSELIAIEEEVEVAGILLYDRFSKLIPFAKSLGMTTVVTSDTYFSKGFFERVFDKFNAETPDHFFISNELGVGKGSGLWPIVANKLGVAPSEILHFGDNYAADVQVPESLGIKTAFVPHGTSELFTTVAKERGFLHDRSSQYHNSGLISLRAKVHTETHFQDPYVAYGYQTLGPIFSHFAEWAEDICLHSQAKAIVPLAREGIFLSSLLEGAKVHITQPLSVSRRFMRLLDFREPTREKLDGLFGARKLVTSQGFSERLDGLLGLNEFETSPQEENRILSPSEFKSKLDDLWRDRLKIDALAKKAKQQAALFVEHLRNVLDLSEVSRSDVPQKYCLFDIGWNGSIQRFLTEFCAQEGLDVQFVGAYLMTTGAINSLTIDSSEAYGFLVDGGAPHEVGDFALRNLEIVEQSSTPVSLGSFLEFALNGSVREAPISIPDLQRAQIAKIQQGVIDFHNTRLRLLGRGAWRPQLTDELRSMLLRAMLEPTQEECSMFESWKHDDNLAGGQVESITEDLSEFMEFYSPKSFLEIGMAEQYWPFPNITRGPELLRKQVSAVVKGLADAQNFEVSIGQIAFSIKGPSTEDHLIWSDRLEARTNLQNKGVLRVNVPFQQQSELQVSSHVPDHFVTLERIRVVGLDRNGASCFRHEVEGQRIETLVQPRSPREAATRILEPSTTRTVSLEELAMPSKVKSLRLLVGFSAAHETFAQSFLTSGSVPVLQSVGGAVVAGAGLQSKPQGWLDSVSGRECMYKDDGTMRVVLNDLSNEIEFQGWFLGANDSVEGKVFLMLEVPSKGRTVATCDRFDREDLSQALGRQVPKNAGFRAKVPVARISRGVPIKISLVQSLNAGLEGYAHPHALLLG